MSQLVRYAKNKGFTLVELLIVVAIIGILATVGIPTYKRMVQKSKKSEAKVLLGGLYSAEQGFFSEYGAYGTQLDHVGFEVDGAPQYYTVGFMSATCANFGARPAAATVSGAAIQAVFPGYYLSNNPDRTGNNYSRVRVPGQVACTALSGAANANPAEMNAFRANATGLIQQGVDITKATILQMDNWRIDNTRNLVNDRDGVN